MSRSEATLGGDRSEAPPPVAPGEGGGTPLCQVKNVFSGIPHNAEVLTGPFVCI